jgi:hypothetical protein
MRSGILSLTTIPVILATSSLKIPIASKISVAIEKNIVSRRGAEAQRKKQREFLYKKIYGN